MPNRSEMLLAPALAIAIAASGCSPGDAAHPPEPGAAPSASTASRAVPVPGAGAAAGQGDPALGGAAGSVEDDLATIGAAVKLVAQEYALALSDSGEVRDTTELAEAELFSDQASLKYQRIATRVKADPAAVDRARGAIDDLARAVGARRPPSDVARIARSAGEALLVLGPAESGATAGLRAATAQADRAIEAEAQVDDYRIAVFVEPPVQIHARPGSPASTQAAADGASYLGVVLRERRTKRFLPGSRVTAEWLDAAGASLARADLAPLWGDFPQYGANVPAPAATSGRLRIRVDPPHHARHGDMLGCVAKPAEATFDYTLVAGRPGFPPSPPAAVEGDYHLGDDILQGFAEARGVADAGDYRVGFIAEAPEPFWTWKDGPTLKAVRPEDTHHLEVVLQDRSTGLLVPEAGVTLTLTPRVGGEPVRVPMHGLLSSFQHYGETLRVAPGEYRVRVEVEPPGTAVIGEPRFLGAASTEFDWRVEPPPAERAAG